MNWYLLFVISGLTLVTISTRSAFLILGDYVALPDLVQRALRYAPACALVAIVVPDLVTGSGLMQGQVMWTLLNPKLLGACTAVIVLHYSKSVVWCIAAGMVTFWVSRTLL